MMNRRRQSEAAQRAAERRLREDEAPRLAEVVPKLLTLRIQMDERRRGTQLPESSHIRLVPVENAPALFVVPCHDTLCRDGGHDITNAVLSVVRQGSVHHVGEDECRGYLGSEGCGRVLHYVIDATYRP
jgi:hypothetical protein